MPPRSEDIPPIFRLLHWLTRHWFYLSLGIVCLIGWFYPPAGAWMKSVNATPYLVAFTFFLNGFTLSTTSLVCNLRQWPALIAAIFIIFVISPVSMLIVRTLIPGGHTPLAIGYQLLSAVPPTLVSAVVLTRMARGNGALALYVTIVANVLAIVIVPPIMLFSLGSHAANINVPATSATLTVTVLIPTLLGQLARWRWKAWAERHIHALGIAAQATILLFILTALHALPRTGISTAIWGAVFALGVAFHLYLLAIGNVTGRLLHADLFTRRALTLSVAQKTLILSVFLWERLLAPLGPAYGIAILPAIAYYVIELTLDSIIAQRWGHQLTEVAPDCME